MSKEVDINTLEVGRKVVFVGFSDGSDDIEQAHLLEEGEVYEIVKVVPEEGGNQAMAEIGAPNPEFDDSKRPSKKNPKLITFTVFGDEVSLDGVMEDEHVEPEAVGEEETVEEPAPAPKKTTSTKKAPPKKKAATKKAAPKAGATKNAAPKKKAATKPAVEFDQEELDRTENEPALTKKTAPKKKGTVKKSATKKAATKKAPAKKGASKAVTKSKKKNDDADNQYDEDKVLILTEEEEDQDILALVREADDLIDLAQAEIHEASLTEFKLGGILYHVKRSKQWKDAEESKYDRKGGWGDFISEVLGMEYRKAMYLIDIYTKFNKYGIPAEQAARMGWTKASVVAAVMTADNAEDLTEDALNQSVADLKETAKEYRNKPAAQVARKQTFKFRLSEDAAAAVTNYLELAKAALGHKDEGELFEHIVTEWATEHLDVADMQRAGRK